jgi:hypothetical protein
MMENRELKIDFLLWWLILNSIASAIASALLLIILGRMLGMVIITAVITIVTISSIGISWWLWKQEERTIASILAGFPISVLIFLIIVLDTLGIILEYLGFL